MILESQILLIENIIFHFIKAFFVGIAVSVPLGPVGAICVKRAINHGRKYGFFSGLGAASADVIFAIVAILGLTVILEFIYRNLLAFKILTSLLLIMVAFRTYKHKNNREREPLALLKKLNLHSQIASDFISTFFLTITNPITIFSFIAVFSGFRVIQSNYNFYDIIIVLLGMFLGSVSWWFSIVQVIHLAKIKFGIKELNWINYLSILIIIISVIYILFFS